MCGPGCLAPYDNWANRIAVDRFVRDIPLTPRHPTWQVLERIEAGLGALGRLPIQLIWGMRDWCFRPECLERFIQTLAECRRCIGSTTAAITWSKIAHERIVPLMRAFLSRNTRCSSDTSNANGPCTPISTARCRSASARRWHAFWRRLRRRSATCTAGRTSTTCRSPISWSARWLLARRWSQPR